MIILRRLTLLSSFLSILLVSSNAFANLSLIQTRDKAIKESTQSTISQNESVNLEDLADQMFKQYTPGTGAEEIEAVEGKINQLSPQEAAKFRKIVREREYDISDPEISADLAEFDDKVDKIIKKLYNKETKYGLKKEQKDEIYNLLKSDENFTKITRKLEKLSGKRKDKKIKSYLPQRFASAGKYKAEPVSQNNDMSLNFGTCPMASYTTGITILRTPRSGGIYYGSSFVRDVINTAGEVPCDYELRTPVSAMRLVTHNSYAGKCILDQFSSIGSNSTRDRFIFGSLRIWTFCDAFWDGRAITQYINFSQ